MSLPHAVWERLGSAPGRTRLLWVAVAAVAAHASVLRGGFLWLDHAHVEERLAIRPPAAFIELFREPFAGTGYYRPLTALTLSIDALAGTPLAFHLTNLLLHVLAAALLLLAAEALAVESRAATLGALLFAVHPVGSVVAGAIAFRSEALIACGLFGLLLAHARGRPLLAAAALLVAGLSKETGLALAPLLVAALELRRRAPRRLPLLLAEGAALGGALALRWAYAPRLPGHFPDFGASEALGTRLAALAKSVAFVLLPIDAHVCDAFPRTGAAAPLALAGAALVLGLVVLAWRGGVVGLLLALSALPSLQLVPTLRWWSPHYLYLPAAWLFLLIAARVGRRGASAGLVLVVAALVAGVGSWQLGHRYRSDETLWQPEVLREPACREGHFYLGESARARGDLAAAAAHYEAALRSREGVLAFVDLEATLTNLGLVLFRQGRFEEARGAFEAALGHSRHPLTRRKLNHDLAAVALATGEPERALALLEPEVARPDALPESLALYERARRGFR